MVYTKIGGLDTSALCIAQEHVIKMTLKIPLCYLDIVLEIINYDILKATYPNLSIGESYAQHFLLHRWKNLTPGPSPPPIIFVTVWNS